MDELPDQARELLRLASDMHDPPNAEARLRVRRAVAVAVATGVGVTIASHAVAQGTVKAGLFSGMAAKLAGAGVAVAVVSALAVTAPQLTAPKPQATQHAQARSRKHPVPSAVVDAAQAKVASASVAAAPAPERVSPEADVAAAPGAREPAKLVDRRARTRPRIPHKVVAPAPVAVDGLRRETMLLNRASQAIAQGDTARAQRLLDQHASEFRDSALREERDGLRALARCMQNPGRAKQEGQRFVARSPESVLAQRVLRACQIEEKP